MSGGSQGFANPGTQVTAQNKLDFQIRQAINEINTSIPVQIVRAPYDRSGNTITPGSAVPIGFVDVLPLVNQRNADGTNTPHQTVYKISYHRFQGGHGAVISDPVVGDQGLMVVAQSDTSTVKQTNAQGPSGSSRKFEMSDGTYYGSTQGSTAPTQYLSFMSQGFKIVDTFGNSIVGTANGVTINGCLINLSGDVITPAGTDLDNHVHSGVTTGSSNTGKPNP